ncbi:MAG: InlB B-repeat-containing protein [Clostridia bacterium]|nr:InlB B-repeat-containing protein [Clostridia bacterium]
MAFSDEMNNIEENNVTEETVEETVTEEIVEETIATEPAVVKKPLDKKKIALIAGIAAGVGAVVIGTIVAIAASKGGKEEIEYSFITDGGVAIENVTLEKGESFELPTPTKEGYKFEGWYTNPEFTGDRVTTVVADKSVTYYAKWTALCAITLDVNGGSLSETSIYAEAGVSVYELVKDLTPTKPGLTFGAWFVNGKELDKNVRVPAEGISLKAEYKVEYTVEIYMDNLDGDGYAKSEEASFVASDYVGKKISPDFDVTGCTQTDNAEEVLTVTLSETAANNVLKAYFNRKTYTITFNPNYPGNGSIGKKTIDAKYGAEVPVTSDVSEYMKEGYCMVGWSTSATSGEITYAADLDALLYNAGANEDKGYTIKVERETVLYGVWQKGSTDIFGGNDYVFYTEGMGETIYLARGNVFFKGEYDAEKNTFKFKEGKYVILEGKLLENGKFLYSNTERQVSSKLYKAGVGLDENVMLRMDDTDGITYTTYDAETGKKATESKGTYERVKDNEYLATFTETDGEEVTTTLYFMVGQVEGESAFQIRNEEEYNAGAFIFSGIMKNELGGYTFGYRNDISLTFDGFGTATWSQSGANSYYNYKKLEDGTYVLTDSNENEFGVVRLSTDANVQTQAKSFFVYDKRLDTTVTLEDGATLTMNGIGSATYTKDNKTVTSYYVTTNMPMGGTMVSIVEDKNNYLEYKFLLTFKEEGETEVIDTAKELLNTYAQYYYKDEKSLYYAPMLVLDEEEAGRASLYGYTAQRTYLKVAEGTYTKLEDGTYLFERDGDGSNYEYVQEEPINLSTVEKFVFQIGNQSGYEIHYWYSFNDVTMGDNVDYTSGEATLKLVGGFAYYKATASMNVAVGAFTKNGNVITFTDAKGEEYYIELDDDAKSFAVLEYAPYTAYWLEPNNQGNSDYSLKFDGKGGATYTVVDGETTTETVGTIALTGATTLFGEDVYVFTASDNSVTFEYIMLTSGATTFYLKKDVTYAAGEYTSTQSAMDGVFTLDGFCNEAKYVDGDLVYEGKYYVKDNVVYFQSQGQTYVLDKAGDKQFTLRGEEYGNYAFFENQYFGDLYFEFDGYGKLTVFNLEKQGDEYVRANVQTGTYDKNGSVYTLIFGEEANKKTYICEYNGLSYKGEDEKSYKVLSNKADVARNVLIDTEDWAVLILDEFGGAIKYDTMGQKRTGRYTRITDTLLYFVNSQGTDACLYNCDMENGKASPSDLKDRSYYTSDLKALNFTKYGFAIFNGDQENVRFYQMDGNNVIIYRRPINETEEVNEYGFVTDTSFGELNDEAKEYGGDTYNRNGGAEIDFGRVETNLSSYPIYMLGKKLTINELTFAPAGGDNFQVAARINMTVEETESGSTSTQAMTCSVVREDGEMYVLFNGFRLYINATFAGNGGESTFEAYDLKFKQNMYSYRYLDIYYRLYAIYGASSANSYQNTIGNITLEMDFDVNGKEESNKMSAEFGENANLYDSDNKSLTKLEDKPFTAVGDSGLYYVDTTMDDGYTYRLYFGMQTHQVLRATGYIVVGFVRMQEFTVDGGAMGEYTISVGRTITSETGLKAGGVFSMELKNAQGSLGMKYTSLDSDSLFEVNGEYRYVDRAENGKVTYYCVTLTENEGGAMGEEGKENFATYQSAVVTAMAEATVMCEAEDEERIAEIVNGEVVLLRLHGVLVVATESTYDADTKTYTVDTKKGTKYTVKVEGENVLIDVVKN